MSWYFNLVFIFLMLIVLVTKYHVFFMVIVHAFLEHIKYLGLENCMGCQPQAVGVKLLWNIA